MNTVASLFPNLRTRHEVSSIIQLLLFLCLSAGLTPANAQAGRKIALLIGIGNYPPEGGWKPISSANDLVVMRDVLQRRGFPAENIILLKDEAATRQGILNAWQQDLLPRIHKDDVVYVQFSGHGQQIADDSGDELDGYDEGIVPYDSPLHYKAGVYQGENLIRDDTLNQLFTDLRRRLGPKGNLLVVIDACHSGTGTRGLEQRVRGTDVPMASEDYIQKTARRPGDGFAVPQFNDGTGAANGLAPMAAFFGSAQNQLNYETRDEQGQMLGSLTYALAKRLAQSPDTMTYRGLFEQIRLEMGVVAPRQQPQAEGMLDQELLGGQLLETPAYLRITGWNDPGSVIVDAGWAQGLNEGAVLGLYPPETRNPATATPLARGTVEEVFPLKATLHLDHDLPQPTARAAWVYVLEQNFGDLHLGLSLQLPENHPARTALQERLAKYPMIRPDSVPELYIVKAGAGIELLGHGDALIDSLGGSLTPDAAAERLLRRILAYAQAKYLRLLEAESPELNVQLELVPVSYDSLTGKETEIPLASKMDAAGNLHFQNKDYFRVRITNNGTKAAYFTLLDIQPDNVINVLFPAKGRTLEEFRIQRGQTLEPRRYFRISPPAGLEMFKLIATEQAVDLRPVKQSQGAATRANTQQNPLETLFGQTFFNEDVRTRGGKTANLAAGTIHVQSFTFIID